MSRVHREPYSVHSINAKKIAEDSTQGSPGFQSRTSATISIAHLLDIVNNSKETQGTVTCVDLHKKRT